jgi:hypothetical protein
LLGRHLLRKAVLVGIRASEKNWKYDEFGMERNH